MCKPEKGSQRLKFFARGVVLVNPRLSKPAKCFHIAFGYGFTDGATVATNFNSCYDFFSIGTDSSGDIDSFTIRLFAPVAQAPCSSAPGNYSGVQLLISDIIDISIQAPAAVNFAAIPGITGKWTTINLAEPTTFDLLLFGVPLLGLLCGYNRFKTSKFPEDAV